MPEAKIKFKIVTSEKTVFEDVTNARTAAMGATGMTDKGVADTQLAGALKSVFAIAECVSM